MCLRAQMASESAQTQPSPGPIEAKTGDVYHKGSYTRKLAVLIRQTLEKKLHWAMTKLSLCATAVGTSEEAGDGGGVDVLDDHAKGQS